MRKRHRVKPRRAVIAAKLCEELEQKWSGILADVRSAQDRKECEYRDRIARLSAELSWHRSTIERQREALAHPWRHLWKWYFSKLPVTRQKGGE